MYRVRFTQICFVGGSVIECVRSRESFHHEEKNLNRRDAKDAEAIKRLMLILALLH